MRVFTDEDERIAIGFDDRHVRFGGWFDSVNEVDFANAIDCIRRLKSS